MNTDLHLIFVSLIAVNNRFLINEHSPELLETCINLRLAINHQLIPLELISSFERTCNLHADSCKVVGLLATKYECETEEMVKLRSLIRRAKVKNSSVQLTDEIQKIIYGLNNDYVLLTKKSMPIFQKFIRKYVENIRARGIYDSKLMRAFPITTHTNLSQ